MRKLTSVVLELERQGRRLQKLTRTGRLNAMSRDEFLEMVAVVDRLMVNLTDFNVLHFAPSSSQPRKSVRGGSAAAKARKKKAKAREARND